MEVYSEEWAENYERLAKAGIPGREGLLRVCQAAFLSLPADAKILIVGCGTGVELVRLAKALHNASFVAVDPAQPMLDFCAQRLKSEGIMQRVRLHSGLLESLPATTPFDAATAILVSQHIVEDEAAKVFFQNITKRLKPQGYLYSADLHIGIGQNREQMIDLWQKQALMAVIEAPIIENLLTQFDVEFRVRDETTLKTLFHTAGLISTIKPFSSHLYGAWLSRKDSYRNN